MIIEFLMFHNEFDMLELKLQTHAPYVDRFVIVESNVRTNQSPKQYLLWENMERYMDYHDQIIYLKHDGRGHQPGWYTFNRQRNHADNEVAFAPGDIIVVSDMDEFLSPDEFDAMSKHFQDNDNDLKFEMTCYWCYADMQSNRKQRALTAVLGRNFRSSSWHRHQDPEQSGKPLDPSVCIRSGGLHLSWFGNEQQFREKMLGSIEGLKYIKDENLIDNYWHKKLKGKLFADRAKFRPSNLSMIPIATNPDFSPAMREFILQRPHWLLGSKR